MMPPHCTICHAPFRDHDHEAFTLVYFRPIGPPLEHQGHPENALWFCEDHVRYTVGKTHMSAVLAMVHILAAIRRNAPNPWPLTSIPRSECLYPDPLGVGVEQLPVNQPQRIT
ncbi:hypothetical protein ACU4GG_38890 [Streptomyces nojiriensis]